MSEPWCGHPLKYYNYPTSRLNPRTFTWTVKDKQIWYCAQCNLRWTSPPAGIQMRIEP